MSFRPTISGGAVRKIDQSLISNKLLKVLSLQDFGMLGSHLVLIDLPRGHILSMPGQPVEHCYFLESGIASMVIATRDGRETEASIVGHEGMVDIAALLGEPEASLRCFMQLPGHGYRISARLLRGAVDESVTLRSLLLHFVHTVVVQISQTALVNASFTVEQRLARWLLMCADRTDDEEIALTHEFLSVMLNVRRAGVTTAIQSLQEARIIIAERRKITIVDRQRLEMIVADSYIPLD